MNFGLILYLDELTDVLTQANAKSRSDVIPTRKMGGGGGRVTKTKEFAFAYRDRSISS